MHHNICFAHAFQHYELIHMLMSCLLLQGYQPQTLLRIATQGQQEVASLAAEVETLRRAVAITKGGPSNSQPGAGMQAGTAVTVA